MNIEIYIVAFVVVYFLVLGWVLIYGFQKQKKKEFISMGEEGSKIDPSDITVLIPFRDEAERIHKLLQSLRMQWMHPARYVFIDDHSTDNGRELIEDELFKCDLNFKVVSLPEGQGGKKSAITYAMSLVETEYVLTFDADVVVPASYFVELTNLTVADMYALPVLMPAQRFNEFFYELDLLLVNAANTGVSGLKNPIMASGANLLYKREVFKSVNGFSSNEQNASGDDTYLLNDFCKHGADVRLITDERLAVTTETPQSFKEFIDQRLRWVGKTKDMRNGTSFILSVLQVLLTMVFFAGSAYFLVNQEWLLFSVLFSLKTIADLLLFFPYIDRVRRIEAWGAIPLYEFFFPFYALLMLMLVFIYKPSWKGREIYSN